MSQFIPDAPVRTPLIGNKSEVIDIVRSRSWVDWLRQVAAAINGTVRQQAYVLENDSPPGLEFGHDNLADVPGLTANLRVGHWYGFRLVLQIQADSVGGYKWKLCGDCEAYSICLQSNVIENDGAGTSLVVTNQIDYGSGAFELTFESDGSSNPAYVFAELSGTIHVSKTGSFKVQFAQKTPVGASYLSCGSNLLVWEIV